MGRNVDDIPWPARKPRAKKIKGQKKGSGGGNGTTVGMAIFFLALPVVPAVGCAVFILHGYGLI